MAIIQCKMCGGDLTVPEGSNIAVCDFCGREQTIPNLDNEKKLTLFARANRLRAACEFDKAAGVFESIVAEYQTEAEAYWGLVLCKYGIEYVPDAATGKKVPTCHRSSFESVLEDPNLEQALENTDAVARRIYREEARQIEELRKNIIAVSAKEEPYDIFICYKETALDGQRSMDSVLAQDIYTKLTREGYRVFFSRISLEDKLGVEYEPYIFAALNSAKVMLVVGTDYEHFNAVWVKNEWSRFLKLMASDHSKYLFPCYKGIDPYDMPKEFAKLQALDLGRIGADQDLLHGIEKILPRQKQEIRETVKETVVVQSAAGGPNVVSLLKRGQMALEDGKWADAEKFYEDVLNMDAENAEAYIGKFLVSQKKSSLAQVKQDRLAGAAFLKEVSKTLPVDQAKHRDLVAQFRLGSFLSEQRIRTMLEQTFTYNSKVDAAQEFYQKHRNWFAGDRNLERANKFATGSVKEQLDAFSNGAIEELRSLVDNAKGHEKRGQEQAELRYRKFLKDVEQKLAACREKAEQERQGYYEKACDLQTRAQSLQDYRKLIEMFVELDEYLDSKERLEQCREKRNALEAIAKKEREEAERLEREAEAERKRQAQLRRAAEEKKEAARRTVVAMIGLALVVALVVFVVMLFTTIIPNARYSNAEKLMKSGDYLGAVDKFMKIGNYKDSRARAYECAEILLDEGDAQRAAMAFGKNEGYEDADQRSVELWNSFVKRTYAAVGGRDHLAAVKTDGTICVSDAWTADVGDDYKSWKHVVAVEFQDDEHLIALKEDGTVESLCKMGDCSAVCQKVEKWSGIVDIAAGNSIVLGLKKDGTVVSTDGDLKDWTNIVDVVAGDNLYAGIRADGTVVMGGGNDNDARKNVSDWTDIVDISTSAYQTVGLKADGSVLVVGNNSWDQHDASQWENIVDVETGYNTVIGRKADGSMVYAGGNASWLSNNYSSSGYVAVAIGPTNSGNLALIDQQGFLTYSAGGSWSNIMIPNSGR